MIADALEARNAALSSLRDMDALLRSNYPVTIQNRATVNQLLHERDSICETIRQFNAEPWHWSAVGDNSWLK